MSEQSAITLPALPSGLDAFKSTLRSIRYDRHHAKTERPADKPRRYLRAFRTDLSRPVFVVGAPRSGTTFLGTCMHSLDELSYHFEPIPTKLACAHVYCGWDGPEAVRYFSRVYKVLMAAAGEGGLRLCDKTPQHSFIIPFLSRVFPGSVFVHIYRDGRDSALSLRDKAWLNADRDTGEVETGGFRLGAHPRFWVEPERADEFSATSDLHRCIWSWRRHTEAAIECGRALPKDRYCEVKYEDLAADPLYWAGQILDTIRIRNRTSRERFLEAIGGVHSKSVGRWRREMSVEEEALCQSEAGSTLAMLEYGERGETLA